MSITVPPPYHVDRRTVHWSVRKPGSRISMIIVHSLSEWVWWPVDRSGEPSRYIHASEWLRAPIPGRQPVSAHYYIEPDDGAVHEICEPQAKAWHAGVSRWADETNLNDVSIGIELLVEGKHDYPSFRRAIRQPDCYYRIQYRALGWLIADLMGRFPRIPHDHVLPHSLVSGDDVRGPGKGKRDPGPGLDWATVWFEVQKWMPSD